MRVCCICRHHLIVGLGLVVLIRCVCWFQSLGMRPIYCRGLLSFPDGDVVVDPFLEVVCWFAFRLGQSLAQCISLQVKHGLGGGFFSVDLNLELRFASFFQVLVADFFSVDRWAALSASFLTASAHVVTIFCMHWLKVVSIELSSCLTLVTSTEAIEG